MLVARLCRGLREGCTLSGGAKSNTRPGRRPVIVVSPCDGSDGLTRPEVAIGFCEGE